MHTWEVTDAQGYALVNCLVVLEASKGFFDYGSRFFDRISYLLASFPIDYDCMCPCVCLM
jgi:hypothetical protein